MEIQTRDNDIRGRMLSIVTNVALQGWTHVSDTIVRCAVRHLLSAKVHSVIDASEEEYSSVVLDCDEIHNTLEKDDLSSAELHEIQLICLQIIGATQPIEQSATLSVDETFDDRTARYIQGAAEHFQAGGVNNQLIRFDYEDRLYIFVTTHLLKLEAQQATSPVAQAKLIQAAALRTTSESD